MSAGTATAPAAARPVGDRSQAVRFLIGSGIDSLGSGVSAGAAILYFVTVVGLTPASVTAAMSAGAVLGILSPIPVGRLADRFGLVRCYCAVLVLRGVGFLFYAPVTGSTGFLLVTLWLMALETTTFPLQQSLLAAVFDEAGRVRVVAQVRATRNAALGLGTLVAGAALAGGSRALVVSLLVANGLSFFVLAATVFRIGRRAGTAGPPTPTPTPTQAQAQAQAPTQAPTQAQAGTPAAAPEPDPAATDGAAPGAPAPGRPVLTDLRFLGLCVLNGLLSLHDTVLFVLIPLWTVTGLGLSPALPGVMMALNTGLTVVLQLLLGRVRRLSSAHGTALLVAAGCLVAACAVCAAAGRWTTGWQVAGCTVAVVLLTVAENLHVTAAWEIAFAVSPSERRSEYMGAFNTGSGVQNVVGPVLVTGLVLALGAPGWLLLAGLFGGAAAAFRAAARRAVDSAGGDRATVHTTEGSTT